MSESIPRLQLWGDTAVGKTMLLAAAFGDPIARMTAFPNIDFGHPETDLSTFEKYYRLMRRGAHLGGTSHTSDLDQLMLRVAAKDTGKVIGVRDIQGRMWEEFDQKERNKLASDTMATLFVVAWDATQIERRLAAVSTLLQNLPDQVSANRVGLVFTQFDRAKIQTSSNRSLSELLNAEAWKNKEPVVQSLNTYLRTYPSFFEQWFGTRIWLTSAWGYGGSGEKYSASVLTEFGDCLPCHIQPRNVTEPFSAMFTALSQ